MLGHRAGQRLMTFAAICTRATSKHFQKGGHFLRAHLNMVLQSISIRNSNVNIS